MRKFFGKAVILSLLVMLVGGAFAQDEEATPTVSYTLEAQMGPFDSGAVWAFVGVEGDLEGVINPTLTAKVGDVVEVTLVNADMMQHDFMIDDLAVDSGLVEGGDEVTFVFTVNEAGEFEYYCSLPGHAQSGMFGAFVVTAE